MAPSRELVQTGNAEANGNGVVVSREAVVAMQEVTKAAVAKKDSALLWGVDVYSLPGIQFPSLELGHVLLSECLAQPGRGPPWMYLQQALAGHFVCPFHTLGVLTARYVYLLRLLHKFKLLKNRSRLQ
jgi:hypothetical protein